MTIARLLPLHIHGAVEAALALLIMATPFVLGFDPAAMIASLAIGSLILTVAFATHAGGDGELPVSTHLVLDMAFAVALGLAAIAFALAGEAAETALLATASVSLTLLASLTRYSAQS